MARKTVTVAFRIDESALEMVDTFAGKRGIKRGTSLAEVVAWAFGANSHGISILDEDTSFMAGEFKATAEKIKAAVQRAADS